MQDLEFGLIVVDATLKVQYWNTLIERCSGQRLDHCLGRSLGCFFPEADSFRFRQLLEGAFAGKGYAFARWQEPHLAPFLDSPTPESLQNVLTFAMPSENGQLYYGIVLFDSSGLDEDGISVESALDDSSDENSKAFLKSKLEQANTQLLQSEKLAAIGQLAAGVAHEINNPVGYVYSNLQTLSGYVDNLMSIIDSMETSSLEELRQLKRNLDYEYIREDVVALLAESKEGIERVKTIITSLKDFSHVEEDEFRLADIHHGLDTTLNVVNNELKYKAEVHKEYGELPQIPCNLSQINQVIMNLLVNAAHAIEDYGRITLRTGCEGDWGWLEVEDTGKGIDPQVLSRIYEPFFTTKPVGKGTGLGLSLSFGIIEKHNGRIEVTSELGQGSCFRVWLPLEQPSSKTDQEASGRA